MDLLETIEKAVEAPQLFDVEGWKKGLPQSTNTVNILLSLIVALSPNLQEIFLEKINLPLN
jgi:hypothetical protein